MKVNKQVFKYVMRVGPHLSYRLSGVWYPRIPFCENISIRVVRVDYIKGV